MFSKLSISRAAEFRHSGHDPVLLRFRWVFATVCLTGCLIVPLAGAAKLSLAQSKTVESFLAAVNQLGPEGEGNSEAIAAMPAVGDCGPQDVLTLLKGMKDDRAMSANWLRLVAQNVAAVHPPGESDLRSLILDAGQSDLTRLAAFQLLQQTAPEQATALASGFQQDVCLPLRAIAVEQQLAQYGDAETVAADQIPALQKLLEDAREIHQVDRCLRLLKAAGEARDRNQWLGFQLDWKVIGPFDNSDGVGFAKVYGIENELEGPNFEKSWDGKEGQVRWQEIHSEDSKGFVDINQLLAKHNGACVYLATNVKSAAAQQAQIRMGTYNGLKTWVNGKLVMDYEVYHTNEMVDQYVADVQLRPGDNWVVIKLCQNEQKESWAQNWRFLFRVTDRSGKTLSR